MTRLQFILLGLLLTCALSLVVAQQQARKLFLSIEKATREEKKLGEDWEKLQLLQTTTIKPAYIDKQAHQKLNMQTITPGKTLYVSVKDNQVEIHEPNQTEKQP